MNNTLRTLFSFFFVSLTRTSLATYLPTYLPHTRFTFFYHRLSTSTFTLSPFVPPSPLTPPHPPRCAGHAITKLAIDESSSVN